MASDQVVAGSNPVMPVSIDHDARSSNLQTNKLGNPLKAGVQNRGQKVQVNGENAGSGSDFRDFQQAISRASQTAPKWQLGALRTIMVKAYMQRFGRRREPRYGSIKKDLQSMNCKYRCWLCLEFHRYNSLY